MVGELFINFGSQVLLKINKPSTIKEIYRGLSVSPITLFKNVKRFEGMGLLTITPLDGRRNIIALTPKGEKVRKGLELIKEALR